MTKAEYRKYESKIYKILHQSLGVEGEAVRYVAGKGIATKKIIDEIIEPLINT